MGNIEIFKANFLKITERLSKSPEESKFIFTDWRSQGENGWIVRYSIGFSAACEIVSWIGSIVSYSLSEIASRATAHISYVAFCFGRIPFQSAVVEIFFLSRFVAVELLIHRISICEFHFKTIFNFTKMVNCNTLSFHIRKLNHSKLMTANITVYRLRNLNL